MPVVSHAKEGFFVSLIYIYGLAERLGSAGRLLEGYEIKSGLQEKKKR